MIVQTPPKYFAPTRLKDLLMQDNKDFNTLTMEIVMSQIPFVNSGLKMDLQNPEQVYLMYRLLDKYYYSEIGFDLDEQFINRFINKWQTLSINYSAQLNEIAIFTIENNNIKIDMDKIFQHTIHSDEHSDHNKSGFDDYTDTHDLKYSKGVTQTTTNDLTDTATGDSTEYQQVTKDVTGTTKHTGTVAVSNAGNDSTLGTIARDGKFNENYDASVIKDITDTEYSSDKLAILNVIETIISEFIQKFESLFMGVFTQL